MSLVASKCALGGIAARTFRCYGIGGVWVVGCCWVGVEGFASRKEKSNTFRFFGNHRAPPPPKRSYTQTKYACPNTTDAEVMEGEKAGAK